MYPESWKLEKIEPYDFFESFMYRGSWKLEKIEAYDIFEVSYTRGHENRRKLKRLTFLKFHLPGVMKIEAYDFFEVSYTRGHENWRKLKRLTFLKFHVPGVMKIGENWSIWLFWSFMKIAWSRFLIQKNWTNQESDPTNNPDLQKEAYAESFIKIRPQKAKLWPKMVSPWWPKNELIKKLTPPLVQTGKTKLTLWISIKSDHRCPSYDQKGAPWWPKNELR